MKSTLSIEIWTKGIGGITNEYYGKVDLNVGQIAGKYSFFEKYFEITPDAKVLVIFFTYF